MALFTYSSFCSRLIEELSSPYLGETEAERISSRVAQDYQSPAAKQFAKNKLLPILDHEDFCRNAYRLVKKHELLSLEHDAIARLPRKYRGHIRRLRAIRKTLKRLAAEIMHVRERLAPRLMRLQKKLSPVENQTLEPEKVWTVDEELPLEPPEGEAERPENVLIEDASIEQELALLEAEGEDLQSEDMPIDRALLETAANEIAQFETLSKLSQAEEILRHLAQEFREKERGLVSLLHPATRSTNEELSRWEPLVKDYTGPIPVVSDIPVPKKKTPHQYLWKEIKHLLDRVFATAHKKVSDRTKYAIVLAVCDIGGIHGIDPRAISQYFMRSRPHKSSPPKK